MIKFGEHVEAKSSILVDRKFTVKTNHVDLFEKGLESIYGFLGIGCVNNAQNVHPYGHNALVVNNNKDYKFTFLWLKFIVVCGIVPFLRQQEQMWTLLMIWDFSSYEQICSFCKLLTIATKFFITLRTK